MVPTIQKYVKYLSDKAYGKQYRTEKEMELREQKMQADIALKESQGELHRLKTSIAAGDYISIEEVRLDYAKFFVVFKKFAMSLPARVSGMLSGQLEPLEARRIEKEISSEISSLLNSFVIAGIVEPKDAKGILKNGETQKTLEEEVPDTLDQFCKRTLRIHYYIRYMDDVIILSDDKEQLKRWKGVIEEFVEKELELALNKKTCIRPVSQGIEFVGYRIWSTHVTIRKSSSLRIRRSLRGIARKYHDYEMTFEDADKRFQCYMGMLQHFDSHNLKTAILDEFVLTHGDRISPEEEI